MKKLILFLLVLATLFGLSKAHAMPMHFEDDFFATEMKLGLAPCEFDRESSYQYGKVAEFDDLYHTPGYVSITSSRNLSEDGQSPVEGFVSLSYLGAKGTHSHAFSEAGVGSLDIRPEDLDLLQANVGLKYFFQPHSESLNPYLGLKVGAFGHTGVDAERYVDGARVGSPVQFFKPQIGLCGGVSAGLDCKVSDNVALGASVEAIYTQEFKRNARWLDDLAYTTNQRFNDVGSLWSFPVSVNVKCYF